MSVGIGAERCRHAEEATKPKVCPVPACSGRLSTADLFGIAIAKFD